MYESRVINEPTFINITCANDTAFRNIFEFLDKGIKQPIFCKFESENIHGSLTIE